MTSTFTSPTQLSLGMYFPCFLLPSQSPVRACLQLCLRLRTHEMYRDIFLLVCLLLNLENYQVQAAVHFNCPQLPPLSQPARNVYELRPQDIKVVMALGDSITAGT